MKNSILRNEIITKELILMDLLTNTELVGGIYSMGYEECLVLSNDIWKQNAGGVPQHCFLLATVMESNQAPDNEDDEEIILLRVVGPAYLPTENELINVRSDAMREIITEKGRESMKDPKQIIDVITRNEIQFSGIKAKILGTFYEKIVENKRILEFGSDIDNFYSSSRYKVYKPYGNSLSIIASYPLITEQEELIRKNKGKSPSRIRIGTVRYSSTLRRSKRIDNEKNVLVPVNVNIEDFISMKTAIFGMTRLGKSNTMKIIATAVFQHAFENNEKIGQLLFDPTGEYANENPQDKTALAQIGDDYVTIFKYGITRETASLKALSLNFFQQSLIEEVWAIIQTHLYSEASSAYLRRLAEVDVIGPETLQENPSDYRRSRRRRAALYALLIKAGFGVPNNFRINVSANRNVVDAVNNNNDEENQFTSNRGNIVLNITNLIRWWDRIIELRGNDDESLVGGERPWIGEQLGAILDLYRRPRGRIGYTILEPLRRYHSQHTTRDYVDVVIDELKEGKIVIIDLSLGNEIVLQYCSERIINGILRYSSRRFRRNKESRRIQIFIEEAHRLFNRDKFNKPSETDPYVRLAKEAAKYKIGLIYATQEVTSVESQVLANTSNWIITHLNNHKEVNELSKYYDFKDFYDQIINSEDVGFARIKTRSGRYIIPTQIDLFSPKRIENVRTSIENVNKERGE
ncbi:hypothetical protein LCGC14_1418090 [marine sediment metagenome]|uniref:Helicase HerA central domain-containing protein n=1 Tax=marine sediment metagenome TaxID=412755 RepID=A0A0F9M7P8_9ZZZZ